MSRFFAALAALCVCVPVLAQQRPGPAAPGRPAPAPAPAPAKAAAPAPVYRVELVVFRATSALGGPEDWSAETASQSPDAAGADADPGDVTPAGTAAATAAAAAAQQAEQRSSVHLLPPADFQLDALVKRLRFSGRYVPVAHVAWSQTASPWDRPIEIPVQSLGIGEKGLTGSVALERGEFLHLALLLDYAMDDPPPGLDAAPGTVFALHESHRVRFDQRNYFDHPAFGVIALVTPDKEPRRPRR